MRPLLISIFLTLNLQACATTSGYESNLRSWVGHDFSELVKKWGPPIGTYDDPNGDKIYAYYKQGNALLDSDQLSNGQIYGYSRPSYCKTTFTVKAGKITGWTWKGTSCRS